MKDLVSAAEKPSESHRPAAASAGLASTSTIRPPAFAGLALDWDDVWRVKRSVVARS